MELLMMQFFLDSCYFLAVRSRCNHTL